MTEADNANFEEQMAPFSLSELVDLALCSPEVGTVNFNILRLLLHDIVEKLGIETMPVTLGDVQTNQIHNYQKYIAGNAQNTPMPGVLRVTAAAPGFSYGVKSVVGGPDGTKEVVAATPSMAPGAAVAAPGASPRTPRTGREIPLPNMLQKGQKPKPGADQSAQTPAKTEPVAPPPAAAPATPNNNESSTSPRIMDMTKALEDKVGRLERHLEALYQLPTNSELLDDGKKSGGGMTVNDMWQIIQLNNRVASCESAIQKMATLIEDLATDFSQLRGDTNSFRSDTDNLRRSHSEFSTAMPDLQDKCLLVQNALDELKKDLHGIRSEWKKELNKVVKIAGIDLSNIPSFLKSTSSRTVGTHKSHKRLEETPPDLRQMSPESISQLSVGRLDLLTASQLDLLTPSIIENMSPEQIAKIEELRERFRPLDINVLRPSEIKRVKVSELDKLTPSEAAAIKPSKLVHMTESQRSKIDEVKNRKKKLDFHSMDPESIGGVSVTDIGNMTPSQIANIGESVMQFMTPEQRKKIEEMKAKTGRIDVEKLTPSKIGHLTPSQIAKITPSQMDSLTEEQLANLNTQQQKLLDESEAEEGKLEGDEGQSTDGKRHSDRKHKPALQRHHHGHHGHGGRGHSPVDVIHGKIPVAEALPPMREDEAKEIVQAELQKQYAHLQAQQRQLANDIHDKMEFIYQKLLREIVTQNDTAVPYMSAGAPDAIGPGVCTNAGMPPGVAVCQFPEAAMKGMQHYSPGDPKVCPGNGICPASANCPNCSPYHMGAGGPAYLVPGHAQAHTHPQKHRKRDQQQGEGGQAPQPVVGQTGPAHQYMEPTQGQEGQLGQQRTTPPDHRTAENELLLRDMRSLILLDLEKIREDMKGRDLTHFDEQDMVERLDTIWEAIKIIKNNEETLAVKILRQDAFLKKLPKDTIDRIHQIPVENLEAIASAKWDKPMMLPGNTATKTPKIRQMKPPVSNTADGSGSLESEDVQNLYNNLANLIAENAEQKDMLHRLGDTVRTMEVGMVTKQMLVDALGDKADKGQINTKVSYDEFGTAIDDLHTNLRELVVDGFNRNEHWQQVTDDLADEVSEKLDKVELSPLKAFFKSNIKALDDKVRQLHLQIEEPDPAGTRKKLLRDYNCISCDRHCNISGVTNGPTLPVLGPILAGHTTASKRAFDLHRLRMKKKYDHDCRDLPMMERQLRSLGLLNPDGSLKTESQLHKVSRYQGGSHTAITPSAMVRTSRAKRGSFQSEVQEAAGGDAPEQLYASEEIASEMELEMSDQEGGSLPSDFQEQPFIMPDEDVEQAEETEQLLQSYIPAYIEE